MNAIGASSEETHRESVRIRFTIIRNAYTGRLLHRLDVIFEEIFFFFQYRNFSRDLPGKKIKKKS